MKGPHVKHMAQSLHWLTASSQALPITPACGSLFCGNLWKFCLRPELCNLPCQSQGPGRVLSRAERNVEKCNTESGIALGRHYIWRTMEENWGKSVGKIMEMFFQWMPVLFCGQELSFGRAPAPSRLLHMRDLPSSIEIIIDSHLPQGGIWFYLGISLYCWCCTINQCFVWY